MNISELIKKPHGFISGSVEATITDAKEYNGKTFGTLADSTGEIQFTVWGKDVTHMTGQLVAFSGKGMKLGEYKDAPQFSANEHTVITSKGAGNAPTSPAKAPTSHFGGSTGIHGATVGLSVNQAAEDYRHLLTLGVIKDWTLEQEKSWKWDRASFYIRLSQKLEKGQLAPLEGKEDEPSQTEPEEEKELF